MASTYKKTGSPFVWIRYKDETGKWKGKPTDYRLDNPGDRRQAELLARRQSEIEAERRVIKTQRFGEWVLPWIVTKYGHNGTTTLDVYKRTWRNVLRYLDAHGLETPTQIRRDLIGQYVAQRLEDGVSRNYAISEIKFLSMVMDEAVLHGYAPSNPLRKPGLKKEKSEGKRLWSDEQIRTVAAHLEKTGCHWQKVTFYFGLYQACRLRQCRLPLEAIRLDLDAIHYPGVIVKGNEAYAQPIDARFRPILKDLMAAARRQKLATICEVPWDASLRWRVTLDRCGFEEISHHGLRATWITRAAEAGVSESLAMAFAHHSSAEVHRVYKQVSSAALAGISAAVPLPRLDLRPDAPDAGLPPARRGSGEGESSSRIPARNRARNRPRFARDKPRGTPPTPSSEGA